MTSRMRPYGGDADLPRLIDLFVAARDGGPYDIAATAIELRLLLRSPSFNPASHACLWEDENGALAACGLMWETRPRSSTPCIRSEPAAPCWNRSSRGPRAACGRWATQSASALA